MGRECPAGSFIHEPHGSLTNEEKTMDNKKNDELINLDEIEIDPLTDEELESVAGGLRAIDDSSNSCCSCSSCSN